MTAAWVVAQISVVTMNAIGDHGNRQVSDGTVLTANCHCVTAQPTTRTSAAAVQSAPARCVVRGGTAPGDGGETRIVS